MKLSTAHKRALVLLNRGFDDAFFGLRYQTMVKLEKAGYIDSTMPNLVTPLGLKVALQND